jgi:hypothetical protein
VLDWVAPCWAVERWPVEPCWVAPCWMAEPCSVEPHWVDHWVEPSSVELGWVRRAVAASIQAAVGRLGAGARRCSGLPSSRCRPPCSPSRLRLLGPKPSAARTDRADAGRSGSSGSARKPRTQPPRRSRRQPRGASECAPIRETDGSRQSVVPCVALVAVESEGCRTLPFPRRETNARSRAPSSLRPRRRCLRRRLGSGGNRNTGEGVLSAASFRT